MTNPPSNNLFRTLWASRKYWLFPVLTMVIILTALLLWSKGHTLLPFLYSRF